MNGWAFAELINVSFPVEIKSELVIRALLCCAYNSSLQMA